MNHVHAWFKENSSYIVLVVDFGFAVGNCVGTIMLHSGEIFNIWVRQNINGGGDWHRMNKSGSVTRYNLAGGVWPRSIVLKVCLVCYRHTPVPWRLALMKAELSAHVVFLSISDEEYSVDWANAAGSELTKGIRRFLSREHPSCMVIACRHGKLCSFWVVTWSLGGWCESLQGRSTATHPYQLLSVTLTFECFFATILVFVFLTIWLSFKAKNQWSILTLPGSYCVPDFKCATVAFSG